MIQLRACPGIEPGTSHSLSEHHATRPTSLSDEGFSSYDTYKTITLRSTSFISGWWHQAARAEIWDYCQTVEHIMMNIMKNIMILQHPQIKPEHPRRRYDEAIVTTLSGKYIRHTHNIVSFTLFLKQNLQWPQTKSLNYHWYFNCKIHFYIILISNLEVCWKIVIISYENI